MTIIVREKSPDLEKHLMTFLCYFLMQKNINNLGSAEMIKDAEKIIQRSCSVTKGFKLESIFQIYSESQKKMY